MKRYLKWILGLTGALLGLILLAGIGFYSLGQIRINKTYQVTPALIQFPPDQKSLAEGRRIFQYRGCEACHGENLEGLVYLENPAIGLVSTPNLTTGQGGIGSERTDLDLIRAVRHGLKPDGRPLLFMPATEFYYLSEKDLGAVLSYIRSKTAVNNQPQPSELSPTGFLVMNLTREITFLPAELIPHEQDPPPGPDPGESPEYGEYLALSCPVCHGINMSGGEIPGFPAEWPAAGNLTLGQGSRLPTWGEAGFVEIIQQGEKHGRALHPAYMPWTSYKYMTSQELDAIFQYLMSLPPLDFGNH